MYEYAYAYVCITQSSPNTDYGKSEQRVLNPPFRYVVDISSNNTARCDGFGAISGGGATSKLLNSYPREQLSDIYDLLFKPNFGASLHTLKVSKTEISCFN